MAAPRRPGGPKQKLSPRARAAKIKRDEKTAMTPRRTKIKAENQRKRRAAIKKGENVKGKDYDHNTGRFVSARKNRSATKTTNNTMPGKKTVPKKKQSTGTKTFGIPAAIERKKKKTVAKKSSPAKLKNTKTGKKVSVAELRAKQAANRKKLAEAKAAKAKSPAKRLTKSGKPAGVKKMGTKKSTIKGLGKRSRR